MDGLSCLLATCVAILWAVNTVIYKNAMNKSIGQKTVSVIGVFTFFTCMVCFAIYNRKEILTDIENAKNQDILLIIIGAMLGLFIGNALFMYLLEKNNSSLVAAIAYTSPIFVFIISVIIFRESIEPIKVFGIVLAVTGVSIICYNK
jgi:drug/metabolite transporter (DMT)-like permease